MNRVAIAAALSDAKVATIELRLGRREPKLVAGPYPSIGAFRDYLRSLSWDAMEPVSGEVWLRDDAGDILSQFGLESALPALRRSEEKELDL